MTEYPPSPAVPPVEPDHPALREAKHHLALALLRRGRGPPSAPRARARPQRDPLTGLPGRIALRERFDQATSTARREGTRLGILFVDLDGFKEVNDGLSHRAGDAALRHVARCLEACVRGADTVSRHGGDEFVVLLADLEEPADAARVAENMESCLMAPERIGEQAVSMSASIGISLYPDDGDDLEELIHRADAAMYRAKRRGPGHCAFHGADEPERLRPATAAHPPGVLYPHATAATRGLLQQRRMQAANERLLLAALAAQDLQSAAERALGMQTALLARVAHELRNPLTPICMAASLIDQADARDLPRLREMIERQVDQVSRLVGDLLDLSRAQSGKLRLHRSVLDLGCLLAEVVDNFRPAIQARRQSLRVDIPGSPLLVDADAGRVTQMLSNLLDNAAKYTPAGGAITVTAQGVGNDVAVSVSDTGIGIGAASLATIFQAFAQEPHATAFDGAGLGIGLTVVRELALAHGGGVEAISAGEGQGSRFVLTLPRYVGTADAGGAAADASP